MHSLIVSIESTSAGDAFDLDVSLLTKLNIQRRDKEQKPDKWMHDKHAARGDELMEFYHQE